MNKNDRRKLEQTLVWAWTDKYGDDMITLHTGSIMRDIPAGSGRDMTLWDLVQASGLWPGLDTSAGVERDS